MFLMFNNVQTLFMMLGETLCFGAYFLLKYVINRSDPEAFDGYAKPCNPLIMLPVGNSSIIHEYKDITLMPGCIAWHYWHLIGLHWSWFHEGCWVLPNAESISYHFLCPPVYSHSQTGEKNALILFTNKNKYISQFKATEMV